MHKNISFPLYKRANIIVKEIDCLDDITTAAAAATITIIILYDNMIIDDAVIVIIVILRVGRRSFHFGA